MRSLARLFLLLSFVVSSPLVLAETPTRLTLMAYNAENLFDDLHDQGTTDYTYLPLAVKQASKEAMAWCQSQQSPRYRQECLTFDWTPAKISKKIANLSRVIRDAVQGGPDFLVMEEVENLRVLTMLRDQGLADLGYQTVVLFDGEDKRGIDVGIISRYPLMKPAVYHPLNLNDRAPDPSQDAKGTRGILEATFNVNGKAVTVLANHWPSQNNPTWQRVAAAQVMMEIIAKAQGPVIAAGDFNVTEQDKPHAINEVVLNTANPLSAFDAEKVFFGEQTNENNNTHARSSDIVPHRGTHYYRGHWTSLDRIFIPRQHVANKMIFPLWNSFRAVLFPYMLAKGGGPRSFDPNSGEGFSDHLPLAIAFEL